MPHRGDDLGDGACLELQRALRRGELRDLAFDDLYAGPARVLAPWYWTPVAIARRAAQLFASRGARRVLDVGAGAGKFCVVAACACPEIDFVGVEQRPHLVASARAAAARLRLANVGFFEGDATRIRWDDFDGLYFYNPFAENIYGDGDRFDDTVELSERRLVADVRRVLTALAAARPGTCMVTYNGIGGPIPATYELAHEEREGLQWLRLWVKQREVAEEGGYYLEEDEGVKLVNLRPGRGAAEWSSR